MKILKRTNKQFNKEDVQNLFGYKDYNDRDYIIADTTIPFESNQAKKNIEFINKNLTNDEGRIEYMIDTNPEEFDEEDFLLYHEYLKCGVEFVTKIEEDKIVREALVNDALKELVTEYYIIEAPIDMDEEEYQIALCPHNGLGGIDIWDYEIIDELIPNIVKSLIDNGYVIIDEVEDGETDE